MNATRWSTLSEFVKYLGREGLVHVDESERGFYVSWIDNSPATLARREAVQKMERQSRNQEDRDRHLIQEQIEKGQIHSASSSEPAATHLKRNEEEGKISIQLKRSAPISKMLNKSHKRANIGVINEAPEGEQDLPKEQDDQPVDEDRSWILPGIVVKVLDKKLANGKYYRQKGRIVNVVDEFIGEIEMLDSCDTIRVDQELLETSIPRAGESVIILVGPERGSRAKVLQIREQEYSADLELERSGALLKRVDYEHFSRVMK